MGLWQKVSGLFGGSSAREPLTREGAFVAQFVELARRHPLVARVQELEESGLPVKLWLRAGGSHTIFLDNTFQETRDQPPDEKQRRLQRLLAMLEQAEAAPTWEEAAPALVPLLRVATFGAIQEAPEPPVSLAFAPCLRLFLGVDTADSTRIVQAEQLREWGQTVEQAVSRAIENLSRHVASGLDAEPYDASAPYPLWHVTRDDSYEASRLLLPGYLASFRGKVSGTPIAIVPHRTLVLIAGDGDPQIARLAQTAEAEFTASPRSVSAGLYTLREDDAVVPLHLPREHPLHATVERGHQLLHATCYADQKTQLEARFEQAGTDVFVATFKLMENAQTKALTSFTTMTRGVASLLPRADRLCFVPLEGGEPFLVDWDAAMARAAACFQAAPEYDPPRVRTVAWPDDAKIAELRRLAD